MIGYLKANWTDIVDAYRRAGPIVIEIPLGFILLIFGLILLDPRVNVIHTQPGYAGLKFIDSDDVWGWALAIFGFLKLFPHKPIVVRIISTSFMWFIYTSLAVNFAINSPTGFVWAIFSFFALLCVVADVMLIRKRRGA